jgi:opacity protein-like surface antigen
MYKYLLAAVAAAAIASPAAARDGQAYVGVEGGLVKADRADFDVDFDGMEFNNGARARYKTGVDLDTIVGYDFGMFRLEGELAWKSIHTKNYTVSTAFRNFLESEEGGEVDFSDPDLQDDDVLGIDDHATIASLMANALVDFGAGGLGFYAGVGGGKARVKMFGDRDTAWAYQGILGFRAPISERVDAGLKYRYFRTGRVQFGDGDFGADGRMRTHSLLASLIFNLGGAAPVVEAPVVVAPPPPPATQTCPDGSVILATDVCPAPPPPPPAPSGERG